MPEELMPGEENFSAKKLEGKTKTPRKKTVAKKVATEDIAAIKPAVRKKTVPRTKKTTVKDRELNERLSSIYRDDNGKIPNMREIKVKKGHPVIKGFFTFIFIAGLMALAAWAGFFYLPGHKNNSDKQMELTMEGPTGVDIGVTTTYKIVFKNTEKVAMNNAVITINYPEGFVFEDSSLPSNNPGHSEWQLGNIPAGQSGELIITGNNYNEPDKEVSWRVFINYTPENFQSEMQDIFTLTTKINQPNISLSLAGPDKTLLGDDTAFISTLRIPESLPGVTIKVKPVVPENFTITSSTPKLDKDGYWTATQSTAEQPMTVIGRFGESGNTEANTAEIKAVAAVAFGNKLINIAEKSISTALEQNTYSASLAINGSMTDFNSRPGEILNATMQFKNTGSETYKNAAVKLTFDAPSVNNKSCLNWGAAQDEYNGDVAGTQISENIRRGQISWDKGNVENLAEIAPGQTVEIDFQIPVQDAEKFDMSALTAYVVNALLTVEYTDAKNQEKEIFGNKINITLNSDLTLDVRSRKITDDGVEKRQITWLLNNNFHPLKNVKITADVFGKNEFINPEEVPAGKIEYDQNTKKITWTIDEMPLELDTAGLTFEVAVKNVDPTQKAVMGKTSLSAEDTVTGQTIYLSGDEIGI